MNCGHFDNENREYVITTPETPVKWINYIGELSFGGIVDHTGGSLICQGDPALNRIVKYIPQMPASDFKGETLYVRFKDTEGCYKIFSPYFVPTLDVYERYECRVGLGYTRYISEFFGIRCDITVFIPKGQPVMLRDIRVTNLNARPLEIDLIPVVEYTHFDALKQFTNADWVPQTMQSKVQQEAEGYKTLLQYAFMCRDFSVNYFTSNIPVSSFESDRKKFLGRNEYGTWRQPGALVQPELSNYEAQRGDNIGALLHHLGVLQRGQTSRLVTQLGKVESLEKARPNISRFRQEKEVDQALEELKESWREYLSKFQVETPDAAMNAMLNVHNPRQCFITKNWSRYLSLYQLGLGSSRGIGTRDSLQDVMGVLSHIPEEGRTLIVKILSIQKINGSSMHQFNPLTLVATVGDSEEREDRPHYYGDDHLWCVLAISAYIKETGKKDFLDLVVPYYEKDQQGKPLEQGSVLDHMRRALEFSRSQVGIHGLPLLGFADWNDCVNLASGAESSFNANLYGRALKEMIELMGAMGDTASVTKYQADYESMKNKFNEVAWDGEWYIRYFDFDGSPLGSKINPKGKIYVNSQSWAVLSGFATPNRAEQAMESVHKYLNTDNGIKLSWPGFNGFDSNIGGISTYPPGAKENGGIFLHANPWVIIAETLLGHGDRAFQYYNQINPAAKNDKIEEYECEPYCYPQNILGNEHPQFGLARNTWLSGTASWMYQSATQYILGIQPTHDGLKIEPCIPASWSSFKARRVFRGAVYAIEVKNPERVCQGIKSFIVDGRKMDGCVAPIFTDGQEHRIEIIMGRA
jgi:cellobiose phosphorylase